MMVSGLNKLEKSNDKELVKEILDVDLILPSLDAASDKAFHKIDRPRKDFSVTSINFLSSAEISPTG